MRENNIFEQIFEAKLCRKERCKSQKHIYLHIREMRDTGIRRNLKNIERYEDTQKKAYLKLSYYQDIYLRE